MQMCCFGNVLPVHGAESTLLAGPALACAQKLAVTFLRRGQESKHGLHVLRIILRFFLNYTGIVKFIHRG